jgi:quercetin dioxygenase-like cupin family protein
MSTVMTSQERPTELQATVRKPEEGERQNVLGDLQRFILTGAETGGALCLVEQQNEAGTGIPLHYHTREEETFHVVEGVVAFTVGDETILATAGTTVHVPRGIRHSFEVRERARVLLTLVPAGMEEMFRELGRLTPGPESMPQALAICERYGIFFG